MLVRLLLAVLTVTGSVPVRLCTCDAAHTVASLTPASVSACGHHHDADDDEPADGARAGHDCDCPVVAPQPASPPTPTDAAADATYAAPARLDAPTPVRLAALARDSDSSPSSLPLYLSLRTLRI